MKKARILFVTNVDWFFISHRLVIAEEAQKRGFEVIVAAEDTGRSQEIRDKGIHFINLSILLKINFSSINHQPRGVDFRFQQTGILSFTENRLPD